ncbi:site-specific integrase [Mesorhizobium sp.]|uniref:tyrosine-type recombinase/integrase n=1 Tax=Mesorhizobium sp. TaxID=1871066 RepID=UPI0025BA9D46|nr:site-specific integrase [Mesorhizobium sp.]
MHALTATEIEDAKDLGLIDGMPFILDVSGNYDHDLSRFFRACPTMGVRSMNSLRAYARDIVVWLRFLEERRNGKTVWQADRADIAVFHDARRLSDPPYRISAASWNRAIAALDKLYRWAVDEKLIDEAPFTYRQFWTRFGSSGSARTVAVNSARETGERRGNMRFLDLARYRMFRDVGLRGRLPDGREDPAWRGRNGERNALFAELLITTGLRLQEASSLLVSELPNYEPSGPRSLAFRLAAATAKGQKGREIRLPVRLLKLLRDYTDVERARALARYGARNSISRISRPIHVAECDRRAIHIVNDEHVECINVDMLSPLERGRLVHGDSKLPLSLWLTEGGLPMPMAAWEAVFLRASGRCQRFGLDIEVTPHVLRHSFAVHMLTLLLREQIGWVMDYRSAQVGQAWRRLIGDPLLKLQRLMGHSRIESTYIYLEHIADSQELVDAAIEQWGLDVAADEVVA